MGGLNPHQRFAKALETINADHSDADRIIITGDLTHWGERQAYEALKNLVDAQSLPIRLLIGNHDDRATFRAVFPDQSVDRNGFINDAETLGDTRLIYLDTVLERTHAGHFGPDRLEWLRTELDTCQHARLFMHHNPLALGLPAEDKIALVEEDRGPFQALLTRYREKIDYIHFGHVHAPIHGMCCGIPFASVPSTGNQSLPDFQEPDLLKGAPLPPAYFVLLIEGRQTLIHQIPFTWDGPIMTAGTGWEDWAKPD